MPSRDRIPTDGEEIRQIDEQVREWLPNHVELGVDASEPGQPVEYSFGEEFPLYLLRLDFMRRNPSLDLNALVQSMDRVHLQIRNRDQRARWYARVAPRELVAGVPDECRYPWVVCELGPSDQVTRLDEAIRAVDLQLEEEGRDDVEAARLLTVPEFDLLALWIDYEVPAQERLFPIPLTSASRKWFETGRLDKPQRLLKQVSAWLQSQSWPAGYVPSPRPEREGAVVYHG